MKMDEQAITSRLQRLFTRFGREVILCGERRDTRFCAILCSVSRPFASLVKLPQGEKNPAGGVCSDRFLLLCAYRPQNRGARQPGR
jgi:hypothetical protein